MVDYRATSDEDPQEPEDLGAEPDSGYASRYDAAFDEAQETSRPAEAVVPTGTRRRRPASAEAPRRPVAPVPSRRGYGCADVITAIFLLLTVVVLSVTILLMANPYSAINPFPPKTMPPLQVWATLVPSNTPSQTWTPVPPTPTIPTATPTTTSTATSTATLTPTYTPVVGGIVGPTQPPPVEVGTPIAPASTRSVFPFTVKSIRYEAHTGTEGCNWQSIAGVVFNMQGVPLSKTEGRLTVRITSTDGIVDEYHYTGEQPNFGESGFEAFLGVRPRAANFTLQLLNVTGAPISDKVAVETHTGCNENVVVVEFEQNHTY